MPDWIEEYKRKLVTPEKAAGIVKSGDFVQLAWAIQDPRSLARALEKRREELSAVSIDQTIGRTPYGWFAEGWEASFQPRTLFLSLQDRDSHTRGVTAFYPSTPYMAAKAGVENNRWFAARPPDVFIMRVTPPDKNGYCHFGHSNWFSSAAARHAKKIICEVDENLIRTRGPSYVHVSQVDYFAETLKEDRFDPSNPNPSRPQRTQEEQTSIEIIGAQVATLINDGDTIFFGGGTFSSPTVYSLSEKHDLAIHSEVAPDCVELVKAGVFNGKRRKLHNGVAVVATMFTGLNPSQLEFMHDNPLFELHGMETSNDIWEFMQYEPMVSINNVLLMDLTGQMTCESIGLNQHSGTGGQWEAVVGAMSSCGGRSIHVLSSYYRDRNGQKHSRIMPMLPQGTTVSVPRTFVDYVVTENGIVNIQGKSLRERAEALISIADPDFRGELRKEAQRLWLR